MNAFAMIVRCMNRQALAMYVPAVNEGTLGWVDIRYGNAEGYSNAGDPFFMKLKSEDIGDYEIMSWPWSVGTINE